MDMLVLLQVHVRTRPAGHTTGGTDQTLGFPQSPLQRLKSHTPTSSSGTALNLRYHVPLVSDTAQVAGTAVCGERSVMSTSRGSRVRPSLDTRVTSVVMLLPAELPFLRTESLERSAASG